MPDEGKSISKRHRVPMVHGHLQRKQKHFYGEKTIHASHR